MCDGNIVYQGPPQEVPNYFSRLGIKFRPFCNPADIVMKELSVNYPKLEKDE